MDTVARLLAKTLYERGVRTVFGLPGGEVVEVLEAFRQQGMSFVLVKNESSAVYMADVTARLTGSIGVVLVTLGPGAANAYAGAAHAYLDRAPILILTAQTESQRIGTHTHQVLDLQAVFRPVTKFTAELTAESAPETIRYALSQLRNGRPGPVHLALSHRTAASPTRPLPPAALPAQETPVEAQIAPIKAVLERAVRPIIVAGLGLEPEAPYAELKAFAEAIKAPFIDTPKAKGALPANHPLFAGTLGLTTADPAYELLDEADCVIALGFDVVELVKPWSQPASLIWMAPWQNQDPHLTAVHEYVGPLAPLLSLLAAEVTSHTEADWGHDRVRKYRARQSQQPVQPAAPGRMTPREVLTILRENTPEEIILTTDVGSHKIFAALHWPALSPNCYFLSNGLSAMGFGIPAAIAATLETREAAICITGDAGLAMVLGELALAVELNLPVVVLVMNDNALDLIRRAQQRQDKAIFGTTFTNPDYRQIAAGYGLTYLLADDGQSFKAAIRTALAGGGPALIDIQIDPTAYPMAVNK